MFRKIGSLKSTVDIKTAGIKLTLSWDCFVNDPNILTTKDRDPTEHILENLEIWTGIDLYTKPWQMHQGHYRLLNG